jgi:hypothetical protein
VRGFIPTPGEPAPVGYLAPEVGNFVRADVTFLKQDFSLMLPVKMPDNWPEVQRFDYLVRKRPLTDRELKDLLARDEERGGKASSYPQREAVLFALRELTGADPGDSAEDWRRYLAEVWAAPAP